MDRAMTNGEKMVVELVELVKRNIVVQKSALMADLPNCDPVYAKNLRRNAEKTQAELDAKIEEIAYQLDKF